METHSNSSLMPHFNVGIITTISSSKIGDVECWILVTRRFKMRKACVVILS